MTYLIIQQKMIGDVLTSSIICEAIKVKNPNAVVHYLVNEHTTPILENNPYIDKLIVLNNNDENIWGIFKLIFKIRKTTYDYLIDVYSKPISSIVGRFAKANKRIGYKKWYTNLLYDTVIPMVKDTKSSVTGLAIENRTQLLRCIDKSYPIEIKPKIYLSKTEINHAKTLLSQHNLTTDKLIMIAALGSSKSKTYPLKYMAKVLDFIASKTTDDLLINYIPKQHNQIKELMDLCSPKTIQRIKIEVYGSSLREFIGLCSQCKAIIGNEGGAINIAKAINTPSFAIYSPLISKDAWGIFEDSENKSVHLKEYCPEVYQKTNDTKILYEAFKPELFEEKLKKYLIDIQ